MSGVRSYRDDDFAPLLSLWNRCLPFEALTDGGFQRRVLLDRNFDPEGLLLAFGEETTEPEGFALCLVLRLPIEKTGLLEHRGFITAFGVAPERRRAGVGGRLFAAAEKFFRGRGRSEIAIAPYPPGYFVPGVDGERYPAAAAFLERLGYSGFSEALALDARIAGTDCGELVARKEAALGREGIRVQPLTPERSAGFLAFLQSHMPGDWIEDARRHLERMVGGQAPRDSILVALDRGRIVGYCKFEGEHLGPFGVAESHRGRGIGHVLLGRILERMRRVGLHAAYVLWTGERAARGIYARFGFSVTRRFRLMRKEL